MCLFSWWPNVDHPYSYAWSLLSGKATSADGNSGHYIIAKATGLIGGLNNQLIDPGNIAKVLRLADTLTTEEPAWLPAQQVRTQFVSRTDIAGLVNNPFDVATVTLVGPVRYRYVIEGRVFRPVPGQPNDYHTNALCERRSILLEHPRSAKPV